MSVRVPNRTLGPPHDTFWEHCNAGELRLQTCVNCKEIQWPPKPVCPNCLGEKFSWERASGLGRIVTHCTFERKYFPECPPPWTAILVELEEGPLFISIPKNMPQDLVRRGTRVEVTFIDCHDEAGEFKLPAFVPADAGVAS